MLKDLNDMVNDLNRTNSTLDKKRALKNYPQCQELLRYVYSPFTQFNVSSKNLIKRSDLVERVAGLTIIELLEDLNNRVITGHRAISMVNGFIQQNQEYTDLIYNIIDKNIKIRLDAKVINKIFPGCIPTFDVALANKYESREAKIDFTKETWYASRKLDGVRCLSIPMSAGPKQEYKTFSRMGKEFFTLENVIDDISNLVGWTDYIFDGEICIVDDEGNEDFQSVIKEIRKKDHTILRPKFKIFDILEKDHFNAGVTPEGFDFGERRSLLNWLKEDIERFNCVTLDVVEQIPIQSKEHLTEMTADAVAQGWEGLIIRKDAPYKGKRSNDLLKVKKMQDAEYTVNDAEMGPFRVIIEGKEVEEEMLSAVMIEHKGNVVSVGSGFSMADRRKYYNDPSLIVGHVMTVQYFEETVDKNGKHSLRFPVVKHVYENGRDV